ncbi:MAG TPA: hypothetical protein ENI46_00910, partial [Firmicutes bacterium]|nr:hypothetical protein [Bacillota bacterium]
MKRRVVIISVVVAAIGLSLLIIVTRSPETSDEQSAHSLERRLERLRSVPYTTTTEEDVSEEPSGVTVYD